MAELRDATHEALVSIIANMRERDREEINALRYDDQVLTPNDVLALGEFQWCAWHEGRPVASIGAMPIGPKVWSVWAFGTDEWPSVVRLLSKHVRRFMIPGLKNFGAHRAQCMALETYEDARKWLEFLGASPEATLANLGKNRQRFVLYSWLT